MSGRTRAKWQSSDEAAPFGLSSRRVRDVLVAEQERLELSYADVARRVISQGARSLTGETVRKWSLLNKGLPSIEATRLWARALDFEFVIDLIPKSDEYASIRVRQPLLRLVKRLSRSSNEDVETLERIVRAMEALPPDTDEGRRYRRFLVDDVERAERDLPPEPEE